MSEQEIDNKKEEAQKLLEASIGIYGRDKLQESQLKKSNEGLNEKIKLALSTLGMTSFISGGYKVTKSTTTKDEFDEDALISAIKSMGLSPRDRKKIIKKKEYVDYDELESAIYNGVIKAEDLTDCQTSREVIQLRVKQLKENDNG